MKTRLAWALALSAAFLFSACKGAQWKTTTTSGGKTTVTGDAETMKKEEAKAAYQADQAKKIKASPRRGANEPILVQLTRPTVSENLKKSVDADKMYGMLRKEFSADPLISLVDQGADVTVVTHLMAQEKVGISKATKKLGTMVALVVKAEINSNWLPEDRYSAEESGNIFANAKIVKDFANKSCAIIKSKPHIPDAAFKKAHGDERKAALGDALKSLFKKKK